MKRKLLNIITAAVLSLSAFNVISSDDYIVYGVDSFNTIELEGAVSDNALENNYISNYGKKVNSYINENEDGTLTRLEYIDESVIIETYEKDGTAISSDVITPELDIFGGAFFGEQYNFLVFGQYNSDESDKTEVVRVVKYTKDWTRSDSLSIYGANTETPFGAGSLRMTEASGKLYIHTCHRMYKSSDGLNHQANMTFVVNQSEMTLVDSFYDVMNISVGYCSHSFNQFIQTDGSYVYRVDHGDAYPRAIALTKCSVSGKITDVSYTLPVEFAGTVGNNYTGACIGGFELGSSNCIIAYSITDQSGTVSLSHNIKVAVVNKNLKSTKIVTFTDYSEGDGMSVGTPHLVKCKDNQFLLMWYETDSNAGTEVVKYVTINENGEMTSEIYSGNTSVVSDCHPLYCTDGMVRWYVTDNSSPVLYSVNPLALDETEKQPVITEPAVTTSVTTDSITVTTTTSVSDTENNQVSATTSVSYDTDDTEFISGDANLDSKVNVRDCAYIAKALANGQAGILPYQSDYNNDSLINVRDAAAIAKALANGDIGETNDTENNYTDNSDTNWREIYSDVIFGNDFYNELLYSLIYLDDDEIPELTILDLSDNRGAGGTYTIIDNIPIVFTFSNPNDIFSGYKERGSCYYQQWFDDDYFGINVYEIINSQATDKQSFFASYEGYYSIDGESVSEEEYYQEYEKIANEMPDMPVLYTSDEILEQLRY